MTATPSALKVLHAPMNFANQPILLVKELRKRGLLANHILYTGDGTHRLGYTTDKVYIYGNVGRHKTQLTALFDSIADGYDIYHFWQRSFLFERDCAGTTGLDIPLIKSRGSKVIHRFTGFDLRLPTQDVIFNPYSPFRYGHPPPFPEDAQRRYIDFLREHVDAFLVQDPELQQFCPEAKILPRALDLAEWPFVGIEKTDRPLVVHAPTNKSCKGSNFIEAALSTLKDEGFSFDFKLLNGIPHQEARAWYAKADIIVDQILIGATGVLTLEAWAYGKPCVTYLREDLFRPFYGRDLPVANANPDTITDVLRALIKDYEWRADLSRQGRRLVEDFHDVRKVTDQCLDLYKEILPNTVEIKTTTTDAPLFNEAMARINRKTVAAVVEKAEQLSWRLPKPLTRIIRSVYHPCRSLKHRVKNSLKLLTHRIRSRTSPQQ